ncbi:MAG: phosphopentomutase [bacterium]
MSFKRVIIIIIDACGVGELPDAGEYGDNGASTLPHVSEAMGGLNMPNCQKLGLGNIVPILKINPNFAPTGCFGKMKPKSPGKDSTSGHWEIGGVILKKPFPVYPNGFPTELVKKFEKLTGIKTIGNMPASGTEIIKKLGEKHLQTKSVILYTSADSVWQIAAHEEIYPLEKQYEYCQIARDMLTGEHAVGRVIARPFIGKPWNFTRTKGRKDFSLIPQSDTIMDLMQKKGLSTLAIGKIWDLFAERGFDDHIKTADNDEGLSVITNTVEQNKQHKLLFANLVDFDMLWGHRRDVKGFAGALESFDFKLGEILTKLHSDDLLIITADHGCDPTYIKHTDHTREYVPLLTFSKSGQTGINLGIRDSFSDVACTIAENFGIKHNFRGKSFLKEIV